MDTYQKMLDEAIMKILKEEAEAGKELDKEKLNKRIIDLTKEAPSSISKHVYESLKADMARMYSEEEDIAKEFKSRLHQRWYEGFLILQGIIKVCEEISIDLLDKHYEKEHVDEKSKLILSVLFKLHSKSIQAGKEVLVLLKSGYSDGAMARWRSLHELNVIFKTLYYKFKDIEFTHDLVSRFLDYSEIERIKEIYTYKKATNVLNLNPISQEEEKEYKAKKESILKKYGKEFEKPNNWARPLFSNINNKPLYFSDFEKLVGIDRLTPYYKQANYQIHASPKGIFQSLSMVSTVNQQSFYLFGGSNYGLSLPGQLTGISLSQITTSLVLLEPNLDSLVIATTLQKMVDECISTLNEIQEQLTREENENF